MNEEDVSSKERILKRYGNKQSGDHNNDTIEMTDASVNDDDKTKDNLYCIE